MASRSETWNSRAIPLRVQERAATRWEADGDCRISTYSTASHGYAQVGWNGKSDRAVVLAHRASWEYSMGPVPLGHTLDHLCKQRRCVNPAHLRILPNFENARRTSGRDWPLGQCVNGHPNSSLVAASSGKRHCSECKSGVWKITKRTPVPRAPRDPLKPRAARKPRPPQEPRPPKTHCKHGHEISEQNSYVRPNGRRECLPCKKRTAARWHGYSTAF